MAEPIRHGGNLREAARRYGIALEDWLDLSTGINPRAYPVPPVPVDAWRRLPEDADGFAELAARHYGAPGALPVAGSQAAIRALPSLLRTGVAAVAALTYGEYAPAFERAGHRIVPLDVMSTTLPEDVDHVIVANPNNPTTQQSGRDVLLGWHEQLSARGGTLIIDEAFADAYNDASLASESDREGLVVLRSVGKFYGLAGIRAGFVLASQPLRDALDETLGAWTVSGPARHAVSAAFNDHAWQTATREVLAHDSARLAALIRARGFEAFSTPLFAWFETSNAAALQHTLAEKGIWTRLFEQGKSPSLRIGLTGSEGEWSRFSEAFKQAAGNQ
ncbi:threonine-phosphate decarboxylase CobD [uncultured Caballeronia sp.]|uniref:threonine-phosphate decarboxylase CobD n=1 Tax=uncultured Caballeronia sp. TaxID=1827198 RepID=UPI001575734E